MPDSLLSQCDVVKFEEIEETFRLVGEKFGRLVFSSTPRLCTARALEGEYLSRHAMLFLTALDISDYSLAALSPAAAPLMTEGGSIVFDDLLRRGKGCAEL